MTAVEIAYARLTLEEGRKAFAYDDSTGKRVSCLPAGNLSIAVGVNLENGLDNDEIDWISQHRLQKFDTSLSAYVWYSGLDAVRQSVMLDIAFNQGVTGLLHYPHMLAALQAKDWNTAATECHVANPLLDRRYANLARILQSGDA